MRLLQPVSALFLVLAPVFAVDCVVDLSYASYEGTALPNGVTQWLGLRYAAPPLGKLRFAAPQDPIREHNGTQPADAHGLYCLGTNAGPPTNVSGEDCLFLDVYAPSNATPDAKLPVYLFVQGGGFNINSNPNLNGSGLVIAGEMDLVVVTINYRVGLYGFLGGEEVQKAGGINGGLKDQRKAMHWVQKHVSKFGGDPGHVTLGGDSAGGQSIDIHLTAYGGRNDHLFHATAAESQSFSQLSTIKQSQFEYDSLVLRSGCASEIDTLSCLRNLTAEQLQAVNYNVPFPGGWQAPLFMYGPTLDFEIVHDYTSRAFRKGKFIRLPVIGGDVTNEGSIFAPNSTANISQSNVFMQGQYPALTLAQFRQLNELYPVDGTPSFPNTGRYWRQVTTAYGEARYICPTFGLHDAYAKAGIAGNWNYHWDVVDPTANASGLGVTHTVEVNAIWGPNNTNGKAPVSYYEGGVNAPIVPVVQAYWTSFIRSYNPNTYRLPGSPEWQPWKTAASAPNPYRSSRHQVSHQQQAPGQRLHFHTGATGMEEVPADQRKRCQYWDSIALHLKQ